MVSQREASNSESSRRMIEEKTAVVFCSDETQKWSNKDGYFHRLDGPSIAKPDGTQYWHLNGDFHRVGGPAVIKPDGSQEWHLNGERTK